MKSHSGSPARWLALGAVLALAWILVAHLLVPAWIVDAYHGQSNSLFNRVISGQEEHEVDHYLRFWAYQTKLWLIAILGSGMALYLASTRRIGGRAPWLDALAARDTLNVKSALWILAATGVISGLGSVLSTDLGNEQVTVEVTWEEGLVQLATFGFLATGTVFAFATALFRKASRGDFLLVFFLMFLYTFRELDHYILLRMGRPSDKWEPFFTGPSPLYIKVSFILLMLAIALAIIALIKRRALFGAIARRETWAMYGVVWSISLAASQFIDKFWRTNELRFYSLEETLEMCASAICCLSIYSLAYRDSATSELERSETTGGDSGGGE